MRFDFDHLTQEEQHRLIFLQVLMNKAERKSPILLWNQIGFSWFAISLAFAVLCPYAALCFFTSLILFAVAIAFAAYRTNEMEKEAINARRCHDNFLRKMVLKYGQPH